MFVSALVHDQSKLTSIALHTHIFQFHLLSSYIFFLGLLDFAARPITFLLGGVGKRQSNGFSKHKPVAVLHIVHI